ncbi:hypothetical protein AB406_1925 [Riemerella anatipestifer]|uniref:Uncharacterized protein n=1 Tax=Riemerella anatipestifer TaxID=34085 RepID=A0A1S7DUT2_RIEAN|nr:hypothetical protein AB406_1925 [Riemerella anatipestifer]
MINTKNDKHQISFDAYHFIKRCLSFYKKMLMFFNEIFLE